MSRIKSLCCSVVLLMVCMGVSAKDQAPGYYRMMLGSLEITALSDGTSPLPLRQYLNDIEPAKLSADLHDAFLEDPVDTSINAFLVNTGSHRVLIDTGAGSLMGPRQGKLLANLRAAGYAPEQVDEILITHMHSDHVGGLLVDGKPAFPNATVRAARLEADYWLNAQNQKSAPEPLRQMFQAATNAIAPYAKAGRFKPFEGKTELIPGISARPAFGHTPGHTLYVIESEGQQLVVLGDLVHVAAVEFADPTVTFKFDTNAAAAVLVRKQLMAEASEQRYWVAGAHLAFPGIGHVRPSGVSYTFVPANYSSTP